jgi:hypothetical protein
MPALRTLIAHHLQRNFSTSTKDLALCRVFTPAMFPTEIVGVQIDFYATGTTTWTWYVYAGGSIQEDVSDPAVDGVLLATLDAVTGTGLLRATGTFVRPLGSGPFLLKLAAKRSGSGGITRYSVNFGEG